VSRVVKSMVCVTSGGEPVVVLVGGDDRIDFTALASHLGTPRVRLSTLAEAEEITGYEVGAVAPIGDFSLRTIMDAAVASSSSDVFTGAGNSDDHLQISPAELRRATGCSVCACAVEAPPPAPPPPPPSPPPPPISELAPPTDAPPPGRVRATAEVLRVRRIARLLVFASLKLLGALRCGVGVAPPDASGDWQMILGRSLAQGVGDDTAAYDLMRAVRVGRAVSVEGRVQPNPRGDGTDIVVDALELLPPATPAAAPPPPPPLVADPPVAVRAGPTLDFSGRMARVDLIDDCDGVARLAAAMDALCAAAEAGSATAVVGIDAERQPPAFERPGAATPPLALLQLATRDRVYAIDLVAAADDDAMTRALGETLGRVLGCTSVLKLGFCAADDFSRLARTPGLEAAAAAAAPVLDLQPRAGEVLGRSKRAPPGLAGTCTALLGVGLDKAQQQSDWGARPLTDAQLRYAALDAFCLPLLYDALEALPPTIVDDDADAPPPPTPKRRRVRATPPPPPPFDAAPTVVSTAVVLRAELLAARCIGRPCGTTRTDCVRLICRESGEAEAAAAEVVSKGASGTTVWSGGGASLYINSANARPSGGRYRNLFWRDRATDDVLMCWYPGKGQRLKSRAVRALVAPGADVVLFCRRRPGASYRFCGRLRPAALAVPDAADAADAEEDLQQWAPVTGLPLWPTDASEHIVWRLVDADPLLRDADAVDAIFGARGGVSPVRPAQYL